jgi:hypothetical protein
METDPGETVTAQAEHEASRPMATSHGLTVLLTTLIQDPLSIDFVV